jgi:hypothetical protein
MTSPPVEVGSAGRVLLVCPRFFDYQTRISEVLQRLGFQVTILDDRPTGNTVAKVALRLAPALTGSLMRGRVLRRFEALSRRDFQHVLVIKGEAMSAPVVREIRRLFPQARLSLYLWDAVRNNRNSLQAAMLYDAVSTFDPLDAKQYGWEYRPLFASTAIQAAQANPDYDWSFVGTLHSDRILVLARLREALPDRSFFLFGYFPSPVLALLGRLKLALTGRRRFGQLSTRAMPWKLVRDVFDHSRAVVDIEHPRQVGLTARTIETLLAGRKLITTNETIRSSSLYHSTRVCTFTRKHPNVSSSFFESDFSPIPPHVRYSYSDECWTRHVIGITELNRVEY